LMHGLPSASADPEGGGIGINLAHLSRKSFVCLQDLWSKDAFKPCGSVGPIAGQTQELPALLFSPSPEGPPKTISRVRVIFVDRGHGHPLTLRGSTTGLSATDAEGAEPGRW
jgi:hypothetical protein